MAQLMELKKAIRAAKIAKMKYRIAMRKFKKARRSNPNLKAPTKPDSVKNARAHKRAMMKKLRNKFKQERQKLKSSNNRMGVNAIKSSVKMTVPAVQTRRLLTVQNFAEDSVTGRRRLVGLSELDVSRDVMDFKFITTSDQESEPIEYFLEMNKWDENGLAVQIKYKNPLLVGKGNDNIATSLKNTALFAPASGAKPLSASEGTTASGSPPQVPKGVDEDQLK